jgi:hypothetical protein
MSLRRPDRLADYFTLGGVQIGQKEGASADTLKFEAFFSEALDEAE